MTYTEFAGLERLAPGDTLSTDGYKFQDTDREIIDRALKVGVVTHRHDGHAALADPTAPPTAGVTTGGSIPSGTGIMVVYTLNDADGGETLPVDAVAVTTPGGYTDPTDAPVLAPDNAGGTLPAGDYDYAITVTDGFGGETAIGPSESVTVETGSASAEVDITGLTAATNNASGSDAAAGWRLWRSQGGGPWFLVGTGTRDTDEFLDDGVPGDCTIEPPDENTTVGYNALTVVVPSAGQPAGAVLFNVYASPDGSFTNPALLGTFNVTEYDAVLTFGDLNVLSGAPPKVSTCFPGALPITASDIDLGWLPPVASLASLPSSGNTTGDVRVTLDTMTLYGWNGTSWQPLRTIASLFQSFKFANYTFALADAGTVVEGNAGSGITFTIPANSVVPFQVGTVIEVFQYGAGQITVAGVLGVSLRSRGGLVHTSGQYATIRLRQRATDEWVLSGDLA